MSTLAERRKQSPREKKTVERFSESTTQSIIFNGEGKALGDIPEIVNVMKGVKKTSNTAILLHKVLFGTSGYADVRKKEIMSFNGIKGNSIYETEYLIEKKRQYLEKQTFVNLIEICRLFCLAAASKEKTKEKYVDEIIKFMKKPGDVKIVITEKNKVAVVNEPEEDEEKEEEKKPKKPIKKEEKEKKTSKKEAKKETKKSSKKEDEKKKTSKKEEKKPKVPKVEKKTTSTKKEVKTKGKKK
ncbi:hypothetical protein KM1_069740 [Entamoeba histolytica HM-3:IMSS]|uniref:Uncharacterized protein n=4 Tax=Entamoeba histolytica TaxID=5759 RepID=C4LWR4_ENTH1|nr:hypothetical protein EHI_198680 [Entamoeba histolytica HM-1:IMSS]EAL49797.1 hypothetical protein EHI_198680 [Entamoeba histolytica HM-1:IMSS]EMS15929.1 hypothetical protein KM1_069740 [Entamoeba histolytica HM-3:IMSS]ENY63256.1 hypothetical protein EHI7A_065290 [Entamoeba histolytica HM-1:IMSS-A]GAT93156.1 hypothetical protein CL6EHI_198680 [Entamoeba histolytica]|eukprot:XP_655184.1 hypothetical protein EHI_198680 [Entamoeba histolytica HM-1:IMSS]